MIKFNNGRGAIICDECAVIITVGFDESRVPFMVVDKDIDGDIVNNHFCSELCKFNYFKKLEENG